MAAVPSAYARMIAYLRGRVFDKRPNQVTIDVGGVGYDVHVPLSTFYNVGEPGAEVAVRIHTHVREDALQLYGFLTALEHSVFERLIGISGIGPKLAVSVLSGIDPHDLVASVQRGDVPRLTRIPGVGKKTAERIVLELKDRLDDIETLHAPAPSTDDRGDRLRSDVLSALQNLGYHRPLAEAAVDAALPGDDRATFEDVLKAALRELMR